jgi:transposase-like protein
MRGFRAGLRNRRAGGDRELNLKAGSAIATRRLSCSVIASLCRRYGVDRKTGYKWLARFKASGIGGLVDESRRSATSPLETTAEMTAEIIRLRRRTATGARMLPRLLVRIHGESVPVVGERLAKA